MVATPGVLGVYSLKNISSEKYKKNTRAKIQEKYKIFTGVAGAGHGARGSLTALIVDILTI